jgi:predicted DNA-binding protein
MASPLTLRLDSKTRQRLARIARRKGLTTSQVVRQAIDAWAERQEPVTSPYQAITDLIGIAHGGNPKRSSQSGRRFARLLKKRRSSP